MDFGSCHPESWLSNIPLPCVLDVVVQSLAECSAVESQNILEDLLPNLCFSLPHNAQGCVALLNSLPQDTQVWEKLKKGLRNKKHLSSEIVVSLYTHQPIALEDEAIRVLTLYSNCDFNFDWNIDSWCTVSYFTSRSISTAVDQNVSIEQNGCDTQPYKENFWTHSPIISASVQSSGVFFTILNLLLNITQESYSINSVYASSDYFSLVFSKVQFDLYTLFPPNFQHLVYLLTLPLTCDQGDDYFQLSAQVSMVQEALIKTVDDDVALVKALICFFPFWLPVLRQRKFLNRYLIDWWCNN